MPPRIPRVVRSGVTSGTESLRSMARLAGRGFGVENGHLVRSRVAAKPLFIVTYAALEAELTVARELGSMEHIARRVTDSTVLAPADQMTVRAACHQRDAIPSRSLGYVALLAPDIGGRMCLMRHIDDRE